MHASKIDICTKCASINGFHVATCLLSTDYNFVTYYVFLRDSADDTIDLFKDKPPPEFLRHKLMLVRCILRLSSSDIFKVASAVVLSFYRATYVSSQFSMYQYVVDN